MRRAVGRALSRAWVLVVVASLVALPAAVAAARALILAPLAGQLEIEYI